MGWYIEALKKYAVFRGRARRAEYWYFILFNLLISIGFMLLDALTGTFDSQGGMGGFSGIYSLAVMLPGVAVSVRRLHDTGRSGWLFGIFFILSFVMMAAMQLSPKSPLITPLVLVLGGWAIGLFIIMAQKGQQGDNLYGPDPLYQDEFSWAYKRPGHPRPPERQEDPLDRLERLASLKERGVISEEEFEEQKSKLLK